jgi:hypothetical protein
MIRRLVTPGTNRHDQTVDTRLRLRARIPKASGAGTQAGESLGLSPVSRNRLGIAANRRFDLATLLSNAPSESREVTK